MSTTIDDLVTRVYGSFGGVDFRGEDCSLTRSPDALNMWKDYREADSVRTRPGAVLKESFDRTVWGIFFYNGIMLVHSGSRLFKTEDGETEEIFSEAAESPSCGFVHDDKFYFKDGKQYLVYDGEEIKPVEGYIPTTTIGKGPNTKAVTYEDVNMLQPIRINSFLSDGASTEYYLDSLNIDSDYEPIVKVDGEEVTDFTVDYEEGKITFSSVIPLPLTDGQDNVTVQFRKTIEEYRAAIDECTMLQTFDNRVFFSGNKNHPNTVWHCSLNDPTYCSDLDYYNEGLDTAAVTGMTAGNNALWVFREASDANTTVFYHTPTIDSEYGKIYPSTHSSITTGCVGKAINFNDDICFFSERGMEGISGDVTTEQVLGHRSTLADRRLTAEADYKNMLLEEWEGYLLVFIKNKVYLADSRSTFANGNHTEYEWFYWELEKDVTSVKVKDGILYFGTCDGVYTLTDEAAAVECRWVTPKDKFKYPQRQKTTNKRGCVTEATGDYGVYAKTESTEFGLIGEYSGVTDYTVSRIKQKKFKDLQLKFSSKTRFSLETVTIESFIGGYIKR